MSEVPPGLSERELGELARLAEGTLPAARRAALEDRIAASPELQELVARQQRSLKATGRLAAEALPASLRSSVEASRAAQGERRVRVRRRSFQLGAVGALIVAAAIVIVLTLPTQRPSVTDAARLATQPLGAASPPAVSSNGTQLAVNVQGVAFPNLEPSYGWRALGTSSASLDGRSSTIVFYGKGQRRIGYVIVSGSGLPQPSGVQTYTVAGVQYRTFKLNGALAVTWRRQGHTCVLAGAASPTELLTLASWSSAT